MTFFVGDKIKLTWSVIPSEEETVNLADVKLQLILPNKKRIVLIVQSAGGTQYVSYYQAQSSGLHSYRWTWDGEAAEEGSFTVAPTAF